MPTLIRVLLIDDHQIVRSFLDRRGRFPTGRDHFDLVTEQFQPKLSQIGEHRFRLNEQ